MNIVYTAIAGRYDRLHEQMTAMRSDAEFVAFVDARTANANRLNRSWKQRPIAIKSDPDPCRVAKYYKVLPHRVFPDAQYSLWIDGSISIVYSHSTERLIDTFLDGADLCVFRHPRRSCAYDEARECLRRKLDAPERIFKQVARYRREGFPAHAGLVEASVLLRRHTPAVERFNEIWWSEIERGSRRDQISFNYAARKARLTYREFPYNLYEPNPLFRKNPHLLRHRRPSVAARVLWFIKESLRATRS